MFIGDLNKECVTADRKKSLKDLREKCEFSFVKSGGKMPVRTFEITEDTLESITRQSQDTGTGSKFRDKARKVDPEKSSSLSKIT